MSTLERGSLVIVKGYGNMAMLRRVWQVDGALVLIHDEENYGRRIALGSYLEPVAYHLADTFPCPPSLVDALTKGDIPWAEIETEIAAPA